ncbi:MAG: pyridoxamine 5'-phosphate oxidase family protein [Desulfatitalea sp.]|nr:pyridoxamine 5'-phosphate oxidase family protein [Desulfatitalea sp.]MBI5897133.1 pyridoxamine 5'-phosphate oxidase family protein [Desulfobacterales bacterium]
MIRKDKEIGRREEIDAIVARCQVCHLAFCRDNTPYVIPVCFGYDGRCLYVHTAAAGRKIEFLRQNPQVCFTMACDVRLIAQSPDSCGWGFAYASVVGNGRMEELTAPEDKALGLSHIVRQYAHQGALPPMSAPPDGLRVWRIQIGDLTGKRSPVVKD